MHLKWNKGLDILKSVPFSQLLLSYFSATFVAHWLHLCCWNSACHRIPCGVWFGGEEMWCRWSWRQRLLIDDLLRFQKWKRRHIPGLSRRSIIRRSGNIAIKSAKLKLRRLWRNTSEVTKRPLVAGVTLFFQYQRKSCKFSFKNSSVIVILRRNFRSKTKVLICERNRG